jgi:putative CocE/NonD family hydrolase
MTATVTDFPRRVQKLDPVWMTLADGTAIAATIWLPEDAEADKVPAILEMVPYRRRDGTIFRDTTMDPYIAGHGYAYCRIDPRGAGDSGGILADEYLPIEQQDACDIIAWLAAQPWCTGAVGMTGISWGGFNSLQVAALRPPALKAIITLCSTDDRYADDVHFMGGALLTENELWSAFMLALNAMPPDPLMVGEQWRDIWRQRLAANMCWSSRWLSHQRRDAYWQQGSVCEDFSAIDIPVYALGGWEDSYSNAVFRLMAGLTCPKKALIGPWSHQFPCAADPGPAIGYLQEALRWWDHWLKGLPTGVMDGPMLTAWMKEPEPPAAFYKHHPGRWVGEPAWPSPNIETRRLYLNDRDLYYRPAPGTMLSVCSPADAGRDCGRWGGYGHESPDLPLDQRQEDGRALCFDMAPLIEDIELLGAPVLHLRGVSDAPTMHIAVRLCDVAPNGVSTLITYGVLNLSHRDGHTDPKPLVPGAPFAATIRLNGIGRRIAKGCRLRVSIATQHWPILWPQPDLGTLTMETGASLIDLPVRPVRPETVPAFGPAEMAPGVPCTTERPATHTRHVMQDVGTGLQTIELFADYGRVRLTDTGIIAESTCRETFLIHPADPLSARLDSAWFIAFESAGAAATIDATVTLRADRESFHLSWTLLVKEAGEVVHERAETQRIPRDFM